MPREQLKLLPLRSVKLRHAKVLSRLSKRKFVVLVVFDRQKSIRAPNVGVKRRVSRLSLRYCSCCLEYQFHAVTCNCGHVYCSRCLEKMVDTALMDHSALPLGCCGINIEPSMCADVLSKSVYDAYNRRLQGTPGEDTMYCPQSTCNTRIDLESVTTDGNGAFHCPQCSIQLCKPCTASHPNLTCDQYQQLPPQERGWEDMAFRACVRQHGYVRCARCRFYIERVDGCNHITCRCRFQFCYFCRAPWHQCRCGVVGAGGTGGASDNARCIFCWERRPNCQCPAVVSPDRFREDGFDDVRSNDERYNSPLQQRETRITTIVPQTRVLYQGAAAERMDSFMRLTGYVEEGGQHEQTMPRQEKLLRTVHFHGKQRIRTTSQRSRAHRVHVWKVRHTRYGQWRRCRKRCNCCLRRRRSFYSKCALCDYVICHDCRFVLPPGKARSDFAYP